ncbi:3-phosphoshikimate 1-carboxyvinyltransferase [Robiginitalea aurantiaca]|uniref:3-phosphoshikimate 1-carboxyvinyltransferase n=1 Tax=Robiginitalea aurantiaca TaxID=3056915 RepID=A0ABT7WHW5_9FLAO|nr:3-phosphoshikimate 1-carboxyvinyltransferase [Robiginitalea aurantiaca]MDM9632522.1 3-phosphoshikimate 1-carboxyvinyltransferase [Robiginitalea aurantiaca]
MKLHLTGVKSTQIDSSIRITGSKSESNRLLILQALFPGIQIENLSNSDDSAVMQKALARSSELIDIHHAGTAMRFLTAYFACQDGREVILTGSERMKQRPVQVLVEALNAIGAHVEYLEDYGCPPLRIRGKLLTRSSVELPADISSQYISALLLIAPSLPDGLKITLKGDITSLPYIEMTLGLLNRVGIRTQMKDSVIEVFHTRELPAKNCVVESDWSSASYYFSILALSVVGSRLGLKAYREDSLQGDRVLCELFRPLGVESKFEGDTLVLVKNALPNTDHLDLDLKEAPDLAQTLAVCCFGLGIGCDLKGLHTLKIKETDRLEALKAELTKLGARIRVTDRSLHLEGNAEMKAGVSIETYNDHRMAMAFAPLALKKDLYIEDSEVVSKSYPGFWEDLSKLGFFMDKA